MIIITRKIMGVTVIIPIIQLASVLGSSLSSFGVNAFTTEPCIKKRFSNNRKELVWSNFMFV
jgi:hypothetical protein